MRMTTVADGLSEIIRLGGNEPGSRFPGTAIAAVVEVTAIRCNEPRLARARGTGQSVLHFVPIRGSVVDIRQSRISVFLDILIFLCCC